MSASRLSLSASICSKRVRPTTALSCRNGFISRCVINSRPRQGTMISIQSSCARFNHQNSSFTTAAAAESPSSTSNASNTSSSSSSSSSSSTFNNSEKPNVDSDSIEHEILNRAIAKVQLYGWTDRAILAAIEELGYSSSLVGLFPRGSYDLVDYFMRYANHQSLTKLSSLPLNSMTMKDKLELALKLRLEEIVPHASNWPQAMAIGATPKHLKDTIQRIHLYIDDVLYLCGDKSTNLQWYTHRASLFSVYVTTELYMSTDRSANYAATWNFLHQRIQNVSDIHTLGSSSFQMAEHAISFAGRVACSTIAALDPRRR